jgi:hypothetical protein
MTASPDHRTKRGAAEQRRVAATLSVLAAVGLNLAALTAFGAAVANWRTGSVHPGGSAWITAVYVVPPAPQPPPPDPPRRVTPAPAQRSAAMPERQPTPTVAASPPVPKNTAPSDTANTVRYYRTGEVDRPAQPDSDWNLDAAALDAAGVSTMAFEVFVGSEGEVVDCTILEPKTLAEPTRIALEARLRQTVLRPAERGGVAVPSVRRIEMSVQE